MTPRRRVPGLVVGLVAVVLLAVGGAARAHAAEPPTTTSTVDPTSTTGATPTTPTTESATTVPAEPVAPNVGGDGGVGDLDVGANTPSPRGEPAPPRMQRIADSAIAAGLLVVLAGGVVVAIWTARRGSGAGTGDDPDARSGGGVGDDTGEPVGGPQRGR